MPVRALTTAEQMLFAEVLADRFPFLAEPSEDDATNADLVEGLKELYGELGGETEEEA